MSALTGNNWQAEGGQAAPAQIAGRASATYSERLVIARDTLIVFSMQIVFRITMFLRHLNY